MFLVVSAGGFVSCSYQRRRYDGGRFRAQTLRAERDFAETSPDGQVDLFGREVPFRPDQNQYVASFVQDVGQKCLAQGRTGSVAVGDEFLSVEGLLDDLPQRSHFVQAGVVGFERLFHGGRDDLVLPFGLERASLAVLRGEGDDLRDSDFRGFSRNHSNRSLFFVGATAIVRR